MITFVGIVLINTILLRNTNSKNVCFIPYDNFDTKKNKMENNNNNNKLDENNNKLNDNIVMTKEKRKLDIDNEVDVNKNESTIKKIKIELSSSNDIKKVEIKNKEEIKKEDKEKINKEDKEEINKEDNSKSINENIKGDDIKEEKSIDIISLNDDIDDCLLSLGPTNEFELNQRYDIFCNDKFNTIFCKCDNCKKLYKKYNINFLIEDDLTYEPEEDDDLDGTLFERGVKVLNHASRVPLIECISGYNKLKDK